MPVASPHTNGARSGYGYSIRAQGTPLAAMNSLMRLIIAREQAKMHFRPAGHCVKKNLGTML